jgi:hypothetical protein
MSLWINQYDGAIRAKKPLQVNKDTGLVAINYTMVCKGSNNTGDLRFIIARLICARPLLFGVPCFSEWKKRSCKERTMCQTSVVDLPIS